MLSLIYKLDKKSLVYLIGCGFKFEELESYEEKGECIVLHMKDGDIFSVFKD